MMHDQTQTDRQGERMEVEHEYKNFKVHWTRLTNCSIFLLLHKGIMSEWVGVFLFAILFTSTLEQLFHGRVIT